MTEGFWQRLNHRNARFISILDWLAIRALLLLLGLSVSELVVRSAGYQPRPSSISEPRTLGIAEEDSELGWRLIPYDGGIWTGNQKHREVVLENRTRRVTPAPRELSAKTAMIIGDSSIFGWGLDDEDTFASRLATRFPKLRVVNAAVPGFGALQSMLWMNRIIGSIKPSFVILGYADYFIARDTGGYSWASRLANIYSTGNVSFPFARLVDGALRTSPPRPYFLELPGRNSLALVTVVEEIFGVLKGTRSEREEIDISRQILKEWVDSVREYGAIPIVFFWNKDRSEDLFADFLNKLGVTTLECSHPQQGSPESRIDIDGHPSAAVVDYWAECIKQANILTVP